MIDKLALGTVQFGLDYGISNANGKTKEDEVLSMLELAFNGKVKTLDTAIAYGNSELKLGQSFLVSEEKFQIITKIPDTLKSPREYLDESLRKLNVSRIYGLMTHNFDLVQNSLKYYEQMLQLKQTGRVSKIGVSVYTSAQLEYLIDNKIAFDILQFPYSILDQRFSPYFSELSKLKVETHVRSVFLQGLLFLKNQEIDPFFIKVLPVLSKIREISKRINVPISALALNFTLLNKGIDKVIVGCNNSVQLNQNLESMEYTNRVKSVYDELTTMGLEDENILLPYNWRL